MLSLTHELETLRHRMRRLVLLRGLLVLLAVGVGLGLLLGLVDYFWHWQQTSTRWVQSALWLSGCVFALAWFLVRPLRVPLSDLELARIIQREWPTRAPDLTSAVEFENAQMSRNMGAPQLQHVTVSRAQVQLATVPWQSVVTATTVWVAAGGTLALGALLTLAVAHSPEQVRIGASRLVSPWAEIDWPRRTTLVYLNEDLEPIDNTNDPALRAGVGEPLTIYVENREGGLPAKVLFERRLSSGDLDRGELRHTTLHDPRGRSHAVAVAHLPTEAPFEFRARGGDDHRAPWITIDVVPLPRIESFAITITPPKYTGLPVETVRSGVGHVQGLVGSQVNIRCRAAAALKSVVLNKGNEPRMPLPLTADDQEFTWEWTLADAERSMYWLDVVDPYELRAANPPRYEIRCVADLEPVVSLINPVSDLRLTALADIPIEGAAHDDLGIQHTELVYELPGLSASGQSIMEQRSIPLGPVQAGSQEQTIHTTWNLAELALPPGSQVRFWLQATDACNLNGQPGQVGRSATRIVSIVTRDEKQLELSAQQIQIAQRISQLTERQSTVEQSTREIVEQWKTVGTLRSADELDLDRVQSQQQEIARELSDSPRGILSELRSLQKVRKQNHLDDETSPHSVGLWESALTPLVVEVLPAVDKQLSTARQGVQSTPGANSTTNEQTTAALEQAHAGQKQTLEDLTHLATELAHWQHDQDLEKRFLEITERQASLREQSLTIGQQTTGKAVADLSTQQQADLARAADRQTSLARDVEQLATQLAADTSQSQSSPDSSAFTEMANRLSEQSVAAAMRGIADELRKNHVQLATDTQQKLLESLLALQKSLHQNRSQTAQSEVEELKRALSDARDLSQRQTELHRRTEALPGPTADGERAAQSEEIQTLQKEIEEQTTDLAHRLRREQHPDSSKASQRASDRMREARETLEQEQITPSLERQTEALDELEQARQSLDQELQDASQRADEERLTAVGQLVIALLERAHAARDETIRIEELRVSQGKWTRGQLKSVQLAADSQRDVARSCQQAAEDLGSAGVMGLCLKLATEHFTSAASRLDDRDAGELTQAEQRAGSTLLDQFIASLPSAKASSSELPNPDGERPPAGQENAEQKQSSPLLGVELRLLLRMQEDLLTRTRTLADLKANGHDLTADQLTEFRQLRGRQKKLAETARSVLSGSPPDAGTEGQP